jgi:hypothetical protein
MVTLTFEDIVLELRDPEMGNQNSLDYMRISRSTSGGDVIIFRDEEWPKIEKLILNFQLLRCKDKDDVDKMKNFIKKTLGKEFNYIDQDDIEWSALITNPNASIQQKSDSTFLISLELEAERL